jgi:hypothetical protein
MTYIVVSPRVGTPGDPYTPASEANAQRLLAGGFIALGEYTPPDVNEVSPKPAPKGRKVKTARKA